MSPFYFAANVMMCADLIDNLLITTTTTTFFFIQSLLFTDLIFVRQDSCVLTHSMHE